jgi:hypothetical protein
MHKDRLDAYDASIQRAMVVFMSPDRASGYSEASDIADVIYTAATDYPVATPISPARLPDCVVLLRPAISTRKELLSS